MDLFAKLSAPFPPEAVSWRVGTSNKKKRQRETSDNNAKATKGQVLAYLDARDVMDRLDAVCGPAGWQNRYTHTDKKTVCEIGILSEGQWVWKADGAGDSDIEAEKGALSDAFKRAAVRWGIGRYLYHLPTPWVELDEWERIPESEMKKLRALLSKDAATPSSREAPAPQPAAKQTLAERAASFEAALKAAASTPAKLVSVFKAGAGLCADLDARDPERLAEITALYERLQETPEEIFA
jgi:hypothetical protein